MPRIAPEFSLLVFAKAPIPGLAKTRLAPALGAAGAAELHRRLVLHALSLACAASANVELHCAPDASDPFFAACAERFGVTLHAQCAGDLGTRMSSAVTAALRDHAAAIVIGTDSPTLDAGRLHQAAQALTGGEDAVLCPAEDGGYALIGLKRAAPELFADIAWSTGTVMSVTRERLTTLRWRWSELAPVWDVDRPEDCERLRAEGWLDALPR